MPDPCSECGFEWEAPILGELRTIDELPEAAASAVREMGERAYRRPEENVWSANEYVWHMADTFHTSAEWIHDIRAHDHPTHYAFDTEALARTRGYDKQSIDLGLWSLAQSCRLFVDEASRTDPDRTCYYHDYKDVTAQEVVGFLAHEAVHHLHDLRRLAASKEADNAS